jgi:hypothetical protein
MFFVFSQVEEDRLHPNQRPFSFNDKNSCPRSLHIYLTMKCISQLISFLQVVRSTH